MTAALDILRGSEGLLRKILRLSASFATPVLFHLSRPMFLSPYFPLNPPMTFSDEHWTPTRRHILLADQQAERLLSLLMEVQELVLGQTWLDPSVSRLTIRASILSRHLLGASLGLGIRLVSQVKQVCRLCIRRWRGPWKIWSIFGRQLLVCSLGNMIIW